MRDPATVAYFLARNSLPSTSDNLLNRNPSTIAQDDLRLVHEYVIGNTNPFAIKNVMSGSAIMSPFCWK